MTAISKIPKEMLKNPAVRNSVSGALNAATQAISSIITGESKKNSSEKPPKTQIQLMDKNAYKNYQDQVFKEIMSKKIKERESKSNFTDTISAKIENNIEQQTSYTDKLQNEGNKSSRSL